MSANTTVKSADADTLGEGTRLNPVDEAKLFAADEAEQGSFAVTGSTGSIGLSGLTGLTESQSGGAGPADTPVGDTAASILTPQPAAEDENQPGFIGERNLPHS